MLNYNILEKSKQLSEANSQILELISDIKRIKSFKNN